MYNLIIYDECGKAVDKVGACVCTAVDEVVRKTLGIHIGHLLLAPSARWRPVDEGLVIEATPAPHIHHEYYEKNDGYDK